MMKGQKKMPAVPVHDHDDEFYNDNDDFQIDSNVQIGDTPPSAGTGGTWTTATDTNEDYIACFAEYHGLLYFGGNKDGNIYSFDGTNRVLAYNSTATSILSLCVFNDRLYAGVLEGLAAPQNNIYVFNGTTWSVSYVSSALGLTQCSALCVFNNVLYGGLTAGGVYCGAVYTADGVTWGVSDAGNIKPNALAVFNNSLYAAGATVGIWRTGGGVWSQVNSAAITWHTLYVWNGKLYAGGSSGKIYVTSDGAYWSEVTDFGAGDVYSFIEYNSKLLASYDDKIYESTDGVTWTEFYNSAEAILYSLAIYNNNLYAGTGSAGKVLVYTDATLVVPPKLTHYGDWEFFGRFMPGGIPGLLYNLLMSGGPGYPLWLGNGTESQILRGGSPPAWVAILCYDGEVLTYDNEVLYA